jgi:SAM-dependent methyltransferase
VRAALGPARTVLNGGAGAGPYEPEDRHVVRGRALVRDARTAASERVPAIAGVAEDLPFDDGAFDAAMARVGIHQWSSVERGLVELRRATRHPVVILTLDGALDASGLADYAPELIAAERQRVPAIATWSPRWARAPRCARSPYLPTAWMDTPRPTLHAHRGSPTVLCADRSRLRASWSRRAPWPDCMTS